MDVFVVVVGISAICWGLTMLAIVNIILKDFGSIQNKVIWGVVALIPFVGWIIYFMFGSRKGVRKAV
ncbi:MAG: PLDc N-terminal domain-containing protein [Desulfamplus sp.]|nr:PLDc N-terminal domain-containing protein [Desulfamplus sp.]